MFDNFLCVNEHISDYGSWRILIDFINRATIGVEHDRRIKPLKKDIAMSALDTAHDVDSALNKVLTADVVKIRRVLPVLICGMMTIGLHSTTDGRPLQAAADTPLAASASLSRSEPPALSSPFTAQSHGPHVGIDARQETALAVLIVLAVATARANRERAREARQQSGDARLPSRLGSKQTVDAGGVQ
ncbi:MAG TPA: hypothetical protein VMN43_04665 [Aestuariivirgaceae bacterium]|nr:hypothetical protein [Aestuariivirgaceae bacterium]